jgi:flagellar biosynthesis/type III secretory pathway M-ring protein FliF/YscJ
MHINFHCLANISPDNPGSVRLLIWLNIILLAIIILYFIFRTLIPWISKFRSGIKEKRALKKESQEKPSGTGNDNEAAIAMALYLYFNEMHDEESDVITVKRVSKTYSPWSSKLYSMRNLR